MAFAKIHNFFTSSHCMLLVWQIRFGALREWVLKGMPPFNAYYEKVCLVDMHI